MIEIADMTNATPSSIQSIIISKHVDCERQCPYYYFPICATNGDDSMNRIFVNICEMRAWNCDVNKSKLLVKIIIAITYRIVLEQKA